MEGVNIRLASGPQLRWKAEPQTEVASHVIVVEFHLYLYHLLDRIPAYKPGWIERPELDVGLETEVMEVKITRENGSVLEHKIDMPKRYTKVMSYYLEDHYDPTFFPTYQNFTLSSNGVVLRHITMQTTNMTTNQPIVIMLPYIMLDVEMSDIRIIEFARLNQRYRLDLVPTISPGASIYSDKWKKSNAITIASANVVDLRPACPPVLSQADLGTCGVAAFVSLMEYTIGSRLSVLFLYYNSRIMGKALPHQDSGVENDEVLAALFKWGICPETTWPYNPADFSKEPPPSVYEAALRLRPEPEEFVHLRNMEEMKDCLRAGRPFMMDVNFSSDAYDRSTATSGRVPRPRVGEEINPNSNEHTVLFVGFDESDPENPVFIFQNSWGVGWGDKGFGYLPMFYVKNGHFRNAVTWTRPLVAVDGDAGTAPATRA